METNYKNLIKKSNSYRKETYIDYFFKRIVGTNEAPVFDHADGDLEPYFDISILKGSVEKKTQKGNRYNKRYWRTCIFYFIDRKDATYYLNEYGKIDYSFPYDKDMISWEFDIGNHNDNVDSKHAESMNYSVFRHFKQARSSWFVRSFVYVVLIVCDNNTPITEKDFHINYWNTKYSFKRASKKNLFGKSDNVVFVRDVSSELKLIKDENKDSIDCVKAYLGDLDFFSDNDEAYTDIRKDMDNGIEFLLCQGAARTGKTILAMRLLHDYKDFKLLLMNYNFFLSLKDAFGIVEYPFPNNRIFHHDMKHSDNGGWAHGYASKVVDLDLSRLIVDEAQRLGVLKETYSRDFGKLSGFDEIDTIVNCKNHVQTVFFGDDSQMLNPRCDQGFARIKDLLLKLEKDYREYYFISPLGVPPEVINNVRFLLNYENSQPFPCNQFDIKLIDDQELFINEYSADPVLKKHLVIPAVSNEVPEEMIVGGKSFANYKSNNNHYLFNKDIQDKYFLTAYSVISREIESVYLYIPSSYYLDDEENIQFVHPDNREFAIKHLYTIMSRATMALTICCEDEKLRKFFEERINAIKAEVETDETELLKTEPDYDIFIAYFGTNDNNGTYGHSKRICDLLKSLNLRVFLFNYSSDEKDEDVGFNETWHVISRCKTMIYVMNEYVKKDSNGLILRHDSNGEKSRIYQELSTFEDMISHGKRIQKRDFRFYYVGTKLNKFNIYPFLNRYMQILTQGNSNCCFMNDEELLSWAKERFEENEYLDE